MSAATDIAPMIAAWPPASLLRFAGESVDSKASVIKFLDRLQAELVRDTKALQADAGSLWANVRDIRNKIGSIELRAVEFESVILKLEDGERRIARDRNIARIIARARLSVLRYGHEVVEQFDHCIRQYANFRQMVLKNLRDVRWELIAIDALRHGKLAGPIFDDKKKLRRYLSKLSD